MEQMDEIETGNTELAVILGGLTSQQFLCYFYLNTCSIRHIPHFNAPVFGKGVHLVTSILHENTAYSSIVPLEYCSWLLGHKNTPYPHHEVWTPSCYYMIL